MDEKRVFNGTMDLDKAPEYIREGDYGKAWNVRSSSSAGGDSGRLSYHNDFDANDSTVLPAGTNKTLRSAVSDVDNKKFVVNFNSTGRHTIVEYGTDPIGKILFTNLDDTGSADLLNWTEDTFIVDMVIHLKRYLILTDGESEIKMFDLQQLNEGYGRTIQEQDITLVKAPPMVSPTAEYIDSVDLDSNLLVDKLFKFKYKFVYKGGFESAWSAASEEVIPDNLNAVNNGLSTTRQNLIRLGITANQAGLEKVVVAGTENGGEWVVYREEKIEDLRSLPTTRTNDFDEIMVGDVWTMSFYDPYAYTLMTADDADHAYDAVPKAAKSLDIVNNNTLLLAGLEQGYDRLNNLDVGFQILQEAGPIGAGYNTVVGRSDFRVIQITYETATFPDPNPTIREVVRLWFAGTPTPGDRISLIMNYGWHGSTNGKATEATSETFSYVATDLDVTALDFATNFAALLPDGSATTDGLGPHIRFGYAAVPNEDLDTYRTLDRIDTDLVSIGYVDIPSYRTFKKGSTIQFALSYRDKYGRYFPLETDSSFKLSVPLINTNPLSTDFDWYDSVLFDINHQPPEGAVSYQWMVSPDMKHEKYVDLVGEFRKNLSRKGRHITIDLTSLNRYLNRQIPGINYTYTPGDRVYMMGWYKGTSPNLDPESLDNRGLDLRITGFSTTAISEFDSRYLLKVEFNQDLWDELTTLYSTGEVAVILQIYTPRVSASNDEATIYREIGPSYPIVNGAHSVTSGKLRGIDDFARARVYEVFTSNRGFGILTESRNISDDDDNTPIFRGNVRTYHDQIVGLDLTGSIRFSDVGNFNTVYNGINRFFEGRIYGEGPGETTSKYGAITKIKVVGNYLKVLQEDEVGAIPIYLSMIQDNSGDIQVADSARLLNTVKYLGEGKVGTGKDSKSVAVSDRGVLYFYDKDRNVPYYLSGHSLKSISANLSSYFSKNVKDVVLGSYFQDRFKEYWMTFIDESDSKVTLVFEEGLQGWKCFTENAPEEIANLNGEVYGFLTGVRYQLNKSSSFNKFYGLTHDSSIDIPYPGAYVRTFQSIVVDSDTRPSTKEDGIVTELGLVSDLVEKDFKLQEGKYYANFLRDKASGLFNGKFLKGTWIKVNLNFKPTVDKLNLFQVVVKSKGSTPNE